MIVANNFRLTTTPTHAHAECDLRGPGFPAKLSFAVPIEQAEAVDVDEPNWAALALIYQAMLLGEELVIEADLSALLLCNLRNDLMALIRNFEPSAKPIQINAGQSSRRLPDAGRDVMVGFSGGVDSFSTLAFYTDPMLHPDLRLTALGTFDVGALGPTDGQNRLLENALALIRPIARENGLKLYSVASDLNPVFSAAKGFGPLSFPKTVGFRNAAAAYVLQKGVRCYLTSGTRPYSGASYGPCTTTEFMDPVFQPLLNSESLRVVPAGAGLRRYDKTLLLVNRPDAQASLNPCLVQLDKRPRNGHLNCSRCWKCVATLFDLEVAGRLENFAAVFDVAYYRRNRRWLLKDLANRSTHEWEEPVRKRFSYAFDAGVPLPRPDPRPIFFAKAFAARAIAYAARRMSRTTESAG